MSRFKNLTPHTIVIHSGDFYEQVPPSGIVARVTMKEQEEAFTIAGIPVITRSTGDVDFGKTTVANDTILLVSSMVLDALKPSDFLSSFCYAPDTGSTATRNVETGHIVSVSRLVAFKY